MESIRISSFVRRHCTSVALKQRNKAGAKRYRSPSFFHVQSKQQHNNKDKTAIDSHCFTYKIRRKYDNQQNWPWNLVIYGGE